MNTKKKSNDNVPFDISIWRRASIEKRHSSEKYRQQTLKKIWNAVAKLYSVYTWDELYVFGSVTKPEQFTQRSDIDIGVSGMNKFLHYRFTSDLSGLLQQDVDVILLEDCIFSDVIKKRGIRWKKKE